VITSKIGQREVTLELDDDDDWCFTATLTLELELPEVLTACATEISKRELRQNR